MTDIVCPNCHSVTPPLKRCLACYAYLGDRLEGKTADRVKPSGKLKTIYRWLLSILRALWRRIIPSYRKGHEVGVSMDAHLRRACRRTQKYNILKLATSSTGEDEVSVIAKVTDVDEFEQLIGSKVTTRVKCVKDACASIVTARVRADEDRLEAVRKNNKVVMSLKAARRIRAFFDRRIDDQIEHPDSSPFYPDGNGGKGVIIGIVDFGIDFVHRNFRDADGRTRILALWDQKAAYDPRHGNHYGYGKIFTQYEINEALEAGADAYETLRYQVSKDMLNEGSAHGTYVADIAAGNEYGAGSPGIAPQAQIVFVDISTADTSMQNFEAVGSAFGDSAQLLEAVHFIFDLAERENRPCVVNISLGTNGGPHDGSTPLEEALDAMVKQRKNCAIVIAAGNSFGKKLHAMGSVTAGGSAELLWQIQRFDATGNEMEIWYAGEDRFTVELLDPDKRCVAIVKPDRVWEQVGNGKQLITIVNRLNDPNNNDNAINVFFERGVRDGVWTLRLRGDCVKDGRFHAWIERDESGQSRFARAEDQSYVLSDNYTLSSIACGRETIVVSSFDSHESDLPLSDFSSAGPTRDMDKRPSERSGHEKQPTVSAPGDSLMVAKPRTLVLRHRQSGTSLAAAAVTGTIALILADARACESEITTEEIRERLIAKAREKPSGGKQWDSGYGHALVYAKALEPEDRNGFEAPFDKSRHLAHRAGNGEQQTYYSNGRRR